VVPAGGFAQVGRLGNAALVAAACAAVGPSPGLVLELHAGSGNFTRHLVPRARAVVASDGDEAARARGRRNAPGARWVDDVAAIARETRGDPDTVFVDPPRAGLDAIAMAWALRARRQVVYVSCDPQTLGRDVRTLVAGGFRLESAVALDLMPQTHHVEVVCRLLRGAPAAPSGAPAGPPGV
jgi:23S rRNA (uracil1939-C5)-methyltransferase